MRKKIVSAAEEEATAPTSEWLDLEEVADVGLTSEDPGHPIESALVPDAEPGGWRAGEPGEQTIRLSFEQPQDVSRVVLQFDEPDVERTQEFVLRWGPEPGAADREIVRQRWNFSPQGATREAEEFHVDLQGVAVFELSIVPDVSGGDAKAQLTHLRLGSRRG